MSTPIDCYFCEKSFWSKVYLEKHIRENHSEVDLIFEMLDSKFRLERVTNKVCKYSHEILKRDAQIGKLQSINDGLKQTLFESAGHITAVKDPTIEGLSFAGRIYQAIAKELFPTDEFEREETAKLRISERDLALAETIESRRGR